MSPAVCSQLYNYLLPPWLSYQINLAFTISAAVNGGMSDWFIRAQILK
jgi:hypothetical protein